MLRLPLLVVLGLTCVWANQATAQPANPGKKDNLTRVTYSVADLVIPVKNYSVFNKTKPDAEKSPEELARELMTLLTETVARDSWDAYGGEGTVQYFPLGMAIVVNQRQEVHDAVARVLADLRKPFDTQIALELRLIQTSAGLAERMRADLLTVGQPVRILEAHKVGPVGRLASLDERQVFALLNTVQGDRMAHILQAPKITIFNGQQAGIMSFTDESPNRRGLGCDVWAVTDKQKKVRVSLDLEFADPNRKQAPTLRVAGTFMLQSDRTLIWHLGDSTGVDLWALLTPRVIMEANTKENESTGRTLNDPLLKTTKDASAIEHRLNQPISMNLKGRPLEKALGEISAISGIQIVADVSALQRERVSLDAPLSVAVKDVGMKHALNSALRPLGLTYVIQDEVLLITTPSVRR